MTATPGKIAIPGSYYIAHNSIGAPLCIGSSDADGQPVDGLAVQLYFREHDGGTELMGVEVVDVSEVIAGAGFLPYGVGEL